MRLWQSIAVLALVLRVASPARAEPKLIAAPGSPLLDGKLDDAAWQRAPPSQAFVQKFPDEGQPPSERTTVRVLYDREAIWVGFECEQLHSPIVARLTRRDRPVEADWVSVAFDTKGEATHAFEFQVNAAGVLVDTLRFNDTDASPDWDENWDARVQRSEHGWTAELRIPLRILRFDPRTQRWGLQARRYLSARNETDEWAFIPRTVAGEVSHYGSLVGLVGLTRQNPFELRPYALFRVRRRDADPGTSLASGWDVGGSAGLDVKWHITQNLTLDATIYPDFAQVEADQVVLNTTTYEVFYPEKRPFFLEGMDLFITKSMDPFGPGGIVYTRRIGRPPPLPALRGDPYSEQLYDLPEPSTLLGAAKLTGTIGRRVNMGVFAALTGRNTVGVQLGSGAMERRLLEPLTFFGVFRLKVNVARNFDIGVIGTTVDRFEPTGTAPVVPRGPTSPATYALCPDADGTPVAVGERCFHDAHVAALDYRWRSPGGDYTSFGLVALSAITGGPPRTMPDGTVVGSRDVGAGAIVGLAKDGGPHWVWAAEYDAASAKLDFNDLGFQKRQAYHHVYATLEYRSLTPWKGTVERHWAIELSQTVNLRGLDQGRTILLDSFGKTSTLWSWWLGPHYRETFFDDREVSDARGTALQRAPAVGSYLQFSSDPRRRVYADFISKTQVVLGPTRGFNFQVDGKLSLRLVSRLDLDLIPSLLVNWGEPRYATLGRLPGELLFGDLQAVAVGGTVRATWTFTPRLTLQIYAQMFLAQKHYAQLYWYSGATGPGAVVRLADLQKTGEVPASNPDVKEGVVNVNVVLRWEYRLGSTLFLVYTRSQLPSPSLNPGDIGTLDLGAIRKSGAADVFLIKATYWWG